MDKHVKNIITDEAALGEWCVEIDTRKEGKLLQEIVLALKATMKANDLISLTAPQIGYNKRVLCMRFGKNDYRTFINPLIENNTNFQFARETCSSIPGKTFVMPRFNNVKLYFTTPLGKVESTKLSGMSAWKFQHCMDHLNGMLSSDIGLEIDEMFDNATDEERAEVLRMYAEALDIRQKDLEAEIAKNKDLSDIDDAAKFIASVKSGETVLDNSTMN
jgi:peptide deformylase